MIFMYLHKAYDALQRYICLEILEGYGVGPRDYQILWTYWGQLWMVARAGGYYRSSFQGFKGVTQGGLLSLTIFNVVLDAVVQHWVEVMAGGVGGQGGRGQEHIHQNALFYADDGMIASLDPGWIQGAFSTLLGMFDRVVMNTKIRKMVGMVCRPCQVAGHIQRQSTINR